jgi:hypothetical protein
MVSALFLLVVCVNLSGWMPSRPKLGGGIRPIAGWVARSADQQANERPIFPCPEEKR